MTYLQPTYHMDKHQAQALYSSTQQIGHRHRLIQARRRRGGGPRPVPSRPGGMLDTTLIGSGHEGCSTLCLTHLPVACRTLLDKVPPLGFASPVGRQSLALAEPHPPRGV